jgi:Zn-dependent protease
MKGTIQIARVSGIPIRLHWTFLLLFIWLLVISISSGLNATQLLFTSGIIVAVFTIIILHELGHALMAAYLKVNTKDIILSPVGGLARLEKIPDKPLYEIAIFIAGPFVNLLIALILFAAILLISHEPFVHHPRFWRLEGEPNFMRYLFQINLVLLSLNLLPIFPMDGGRILRSFLQIWNSREKATYIAMWVGILFSIMLVIWGLVFGDYIMSVIGLFICMSVLIQKMVKPIK